MKPNLSLTQQVQLLVDRGLLVEDRAGCAQFLAANNYYRFSGYTRYFQRAPQRGDNTFRDGTSFDQIRALYTADQSLRNELAAPLQRVELLLRSHLSRVVAACHGPYDCYLNDAFYAGGPENSALEACWRDLQRSKERHILRYRDKENIDPFGQLPIWSAVEAWSFGTLPKCLERGGLAGCWPMMWQAAWGSPSLNSPTACDPWSTCAIALPTMHACGTTQ